MVKYVTCRPLRVGDNRLHTPKEHLKNNFAGMSLTFKLIAWNHQVDGRILYEIEAPTEEEVDAVIESLTMYSKHEKTLESAQTFAQEMTGLAWTIVDDRLVLVTPKEA